MSDYKNQFDDPKGVKATYRWPYNHHTEDPVARSRQMGDGAPTSNIGLTPQQGAASPVHLVWHGTFFTTAEVETINEWYALCDHQTVRITDFNGDSYEAIITDFSPLRVACIRNPRVSVGPNLYFYYTYSLSFRVIKAYTGIWAGIAP